MFSRRAGGVTARLIDHPTPSTVVTTARTSSHRMRDGVLVLRTGCAGGLWLGWDEGSIPIQALCHARLVAPDLCPNFLARNRSVPSLGRVENVPLRNVLTARRAHACAKVGTCPPTSPRARDRHAFWKS